MVYLVWLFALITLGHNLQLPPGLPHDTPKPGSPEQSTPVCYSIDSICDVAFNATDISFPSQQSICTCPDAIQCPRNWGDDSRSIYLYKTLPSQTEIVFRAKRERSFKAMYEADCQLVEKDNDREEEVLMKLSFCRPLAVDLGRVCGKFEPIITLTGPPGPFPLKLVPPGMRCQCGRRLYLHRSWSQGIYNFMEYSCGKPKCNQMSIGSDVCMTVRNVRDPSYFLQHRLEHIYPCRCPKGHSCQVDTDQLSIQTGGQINGFCKSTK